MPAPSKRLKNASEKVRKLALLAEWMDESYRAIAPKKLIKLLDD